MAAQVAYLASGLFLDYQSNLIILVVNTLTQDLKSDNYLIGVRTAPACTCFCICMHCRSPPVLTTLHSNSIFKGRVHA